jgi:hypothetical protein
MADHLPSPHFAPLVVDRWVLRAKAARLELLAEATGPSPYSSVAATIALSEALSEAITEVEVIAAIMSEQSRQLRLQAAALRQQRANLRRES